MLHVTLYPLCAGASLMLNVITGVCMSLYMNTCMYLCETHTGITDPGSQLATNYESLKEIQN